MEESEYIEFLTFKRDVIKSLVGVYNYSDSIMDRLKVANLIQTTIGQNKIQKLKQIMELGIKYVENNIDLYEKLPNIDGKINIKQNLKLLMSSKKIYEYLFTK